MSRHQNLISTIKAFATVADKLRRQNPAPSPFSLAFLTDASRIGEPLIVASTMPKGSAIIMRDYDLPDRAIRAQALRKACHARGVLFLIAGDDGLAEDTGADGVHWPSWQCDREKPAGMVASAACHNKEEIEQAEQDKADVVFLSPVFATDSHPGENTLGIDAFTDLAATSTLPVLALGGITTKTVHRLESTPASGFGAIGAFGS